MDAITKRLMIKNAQAYASYGQDGIVVNNPKIYKAYRDGQENGYSHALAMESEISDGLSITIEGSFVFDLEQWQAIYADGKLIVSRR